MLRHVNHSAFRLAKDNDNETDNVLMQQSSPRSQKFISLNEWVEKKQAKNLTQPSVLDTKLAADKG